jgi:hypothetical protein
MGSPTAASPIAEPLSQFQSYFCAGDNNRFCRGPETRIVKIERFIAVSFRIEPSLQFRIHRPLVGSSLILLRSTFTGAVDSKNRNGLQQRISEKGPANLYFWRLNLVLEICHLGGDEESDG